MRPFHLARINIARMKAPLESAAMADFVARLEEINALADRSEGFVWRLQTPEGDATYLRPFDDDMILVNLSVWESVDALKHYVYRTAHAELLRDRRKWFEASPARTSRSGGCRPAIVPESTRPSAASRISKNTARRSSRSPSRPCTSPTRPSSPASTGRASSRAPRRDINRRSPCPLSFGS